MELVWCPPGSFKMGWWGSDIEKVKGLEAERFKYRKVTLTKGFWIGKYEVTQRQWESVMGNNPSRFTDPDRPVEQVSWEDCQAFVSKIQSSAPDLQARLPTSAEWEYACRAGTETILPNGYNDFIFTTNKMDTTRNAKAFHDFAWVNEFSHEGFELSNGVSVLTIYWYQWLARGDYGSSHFDVKRTRGLGGTHRVGQKEANPWGIYDMIGNVAEWCSDWQNRDFKEPIDPENTSLPKIGEDGIKRRVTRGGGVSVPATFGLIVFLPGTVLGQPSSYRKYDQGFRLCCSAGASK